MVYASLTAGVVVAGEPLAILDRDLSKPGKRDTPPVIGRSHRAKPGVARTATLLEEALLLALFIPQSVRAQNATVLLVASNYLPLVKQGIPNHLKDCTHRKPPSLTPVYH